MIETYYRILKHDPSGRLVKDTGLLPSHSYVIQFLEFFRSLLSRAGAGANATDVGNAESLITGSGDAVSYVNVNAPIGNDTYGIVVGTNAGTTAEDNLNYALDTKIATGAGAGQLGYQAVTFLAPAVDGANVDFDITRAFANTSGGGITVKEIGIICKNTANTKYHLLLRDVVADEAVGDGFTLTVIYTLRTTA